MSNNPDKIIIHHSWLPLDNKLLSEFESIRNYHIETNGWIDIGYHFVIEYVNNKLTWREGRKMWQEGAHTYGQNKTSIGICCVGNFDKDIPPQSLYDFLAKNIVDVVFKYYNSKMTIHGHNEYADKSCPGRNFDLDRVRKSIENYQKSKGINMKTIQLDMTNIKSLDEIYIECLNNPDKFKNAIDSIESIANEKNDIGVLEQLKYIKQAIIKFYYHDKNIVV